MVEHLDVRVWDSREVLCRLCIWTVFLSSAIDVYPGMDFGHQAWFQCMYNLFTDCAAFLDSSMLNAEEAI